MIRFQTVFITIIGIVVSISFLMVASFALGQETQQNEETLPSEETLPITPPEFEGKDNGANVPGNPAVAAAARLRSAISRIDPNAQLLDNGARFRVENVPVTLVFDINADRMRLVAPVANMSDLGPSDLLRLMQANFDSALDARYGLAQDVLWATFIHPLSTLSQDEFGSGLGQTINLVLTYGSSYSSGALVFGGGDSQEEQRQLIEELQDKSKEI